LLLWFFLLKNGSKNQQKTIAGFFNPIIKFPSFNRIELGNLFLEEK